MKKNLLSIVIPAYNEERTIAGLLLKVCEAPLPDGIRKEVLVVNDASKDQTASEVENFIETHPQYNVKLILQNSNKGKGAALYRGFEEAEGEWILVQDADFEYDPREYTKLLKPVLEGFADVVYGSRFMGGNPHRILFFWHSIGNKFLTMLSNAFTNLNLTDMETCYKLFKSEYLKKIRFKENRFGFEPEVTAKIARFEGIRIYEVGISYYGRTYEEGKKIRAKDGFWAMWCILKYNLIDRKYLVNQKSEIASAHL